MKIPRTYEIRLKIHLEQRANLVRFVPIEWVKDTIINGRECPTGEDGRRGGKIVEFTKTFIIRDPQPRSKTVVVITEIVGKVCHAITTYYEQ